MALTKLTNKRAVRVPLGIIDDRSQAYYCTQAEYKALTFKFPVGKVVHLNDRKSDFKIISGTSTANEREIIASSSTGQSLSIISTAAVQPTTVELIFSVATYGAQQVVTTSGYDSSGDGGGVGWKQTGVTGQAPSQSPAQLGDGLLNDGNGNQWELVVASFVTPEQLGANKTGVLNAWLSIIATHNYANANMIKVVGSGTYLCEATVKIIVNTNCDYSMATFLIADSVTLSELIKIEGTPSTVITPAATNFKKGVTVLPDVSEYPQSVIAINSNDVFLNRNGTTPVLKKDVVYHGENGHLSSPLYFDMLTIAEVIIKPAETFTLEFKAPAIVYAECSIVYFIRSGRNQVTVKGSKVTNNTLGTTPPITVYFGPTACMDNTLDGRTGDAMSAWNSGNSAYDYSGGQVIRPIARNLGSTWTWGSVDGNVYRDLLVENSIVSRAGCHSMLFNGTFRNLTITEKAIQVTGAGLLKLENVNKTVSSSASGAENVLVDLREDYGGEWDGEIVINDFSIDYGNVVLGNQAGAVVRLPFKGADNYGKEIVYPRVKVTGGKITMSSSATTWPTYHIIEFFRYSDEQLYTRVMPKEISLKDIEVIIPSTSAVTVVNPIRVAKINSANISGVINISIDNVGYDFDKSTLPILQGGRSLRVEATAAEMASPSYAIHYTVKNSDVDAIFRAPSTWKLSVKNSDIYNYDCFFNTIQGEGFVDTRDCNLWSGRYSGSLSHKAFYNCTLKVDGTTDAANINAGVVRFFGGSIEAGFTLVGKTNTQFVNGFYDDTYFEPL